MARLLVADNSPFYRKLLTEALEERGHQVRAVGDGLEALQALADENPDAVVLDLVMPKVNGARACRQIKARPETCSIPVVILSGLREDEIDDPDEIGADAYVAKMQAEQMLEHLSATLDELLAGKLREPKRGFDTMHRREVVSELLQERRSRDAILSSLREGYLRLAEDGRIIEANPAALEMMALGEADIVNRPVAEILSCSPEFLESLADPSSERQVIRLELGDRVLHAQGQETPAKGEDADRVLLLTDVTGETRAEEERLQMEKKVEASERLSALGEVVSGVAHELNNPLTGVLGYADLLLKLAPDERTRERLTRLHHEAMRCRRVVENLLCFARKRQSYRRPKDLNSLVAKTLSGQSMAAAKAGIEIRQSLAADLPAGLFDFAQIEQVLENLLANAFQALDSMPPERKVVTVRTAREGDQVLLEVQDSGPGIPDAIRDRLFEPFFTTHRPEGRTGLGLAVTYGIVEEHGGTIAVSDAAPGTRMIIRLPTAQAADGQLDGEQAAGAPRDELPSVLIVDDEPIVLDLVDDVLTDAGYQVTRAGNGAQALERLNEGRFDAMLIDLKMPDMNGRDLYERVRARRPELASRIVFTTGDLDVPDLSHFLNDSGNTLLRKPFSLEEVAATFQAVLQHGDDENEEA
jgi:two-component system NtrC family sensor kinase